MTIIQLIVIFYALPMAVSLLAHMRIEKLRTKMLTDEKTTHNRKTKLTKDKHVLDAVYLISFIPVLNILLMSTIIFSYASIFLNRLKK